MTIVIRLTAKRVERLDLSPVREAIDPLLADNVAEHEQQLQFEMDYPREPEDPRELSEIAEIRLWFLRVDSVYPWLPFLLDWKAGELSRYTAMLVPHHFAKQEGLQFNPEALELFVMSKIFVLSDWLHQRGMKSRVRLKGMAQVLGYDIDDDLFDAIEGLL